MAGKRVTGKKRHAVERWQAPPQNIEAEQALLGAILLESGTVLTAMERLRPEDFYLETHRIIFGAMVELFNRPSRGTLSPLPTCCETQASWKSWAVPLTWRR